MVATSLWTRALSHSIWQMTTLGLMYFNTSQTPMIRLEGHSLIWKYMEVKMRLVSMNDLIYLTVLLFLANSLVRKHGYMLIIHYQVHLKGLFSAHQKSQSNLNQAWAIFTRLIMDFTVAVAIMKPALSLIYPSGAGST